MWITYLLNIPKGGTESVALANDGGRGTSSDRVLSPSIVIIIIDDVKVPETTP